MAHKKLLIANWKLNHTMKSAGEFFAVVLSSWKPRETVDVAIAPVAPMLDFVGRSIAGHDVKLAAQNVFYAEKGAFTGEWSAEQLSELGVSLCIVGHSERRQIFLESDDTVAKKAQACLRAKITPVICVGESLAERESGRTFDVIERQVRAALKDLGDQSGTQVILAYEPIWAIGTGKTASIAQVDEVHGRLKRLSADILGHAGKNNPCILYGGSVNAENIREIASLPTVDGALVGGASLQAASFLSMVDELHRAQA